MKKSLVLLMAYFLILSVYAEDGATQESPGDAPPAQEQPPREEQHVTTPGQDTPAQNPQTQPQPEQAPNREPEAPQGCSTNDNGTGVAMFSCSFDSANADFKEFDIKEKAAECDGTFEIISGKPTCIKQGTSGFNGTVCPSGQELGKAKADCKNAVKEFVDGRGCAAVACVDEGFAQKFDKALEDTFGGVKAEAIKCAKNGGEFALANGDGICIGEINDEPIGELGKITGEEIEDTAEKLGSVTEKAETVKDKLEALAVKFAAEGKMQQAQALVDSAEKIGEAGEKLEALQDSLATSLDLSDGERRSIIAEMRDAKEEITNAAIGAIKGEIITDRDELERKFRAYWEYYGRPFTEGEFNEGIEREKGAVEKVRSCENYSAKESSFVPPDPDGYVVLIKLKFDEEKCVMELHTKMGPTAVYRLGKEAYSNFNGPKSFSGSPCEGEACDFIKQITTQLHGETPEQQCAEKCVNEGCESGLYSCMERNLLKCEYQCGLKKEGDGPFDSKGQFDPMQACVMMCAGEEAKDCRPGGNNPTCNSCEAKCIDVYGPGNDYEKCLTEKKAAEKKTICENLGMYPQQVEEFVTDKTCITDYTCTMPEKKDEDSGTGPDSYEPGHGPGEEFGPPVTGNVTLIEGIMDWIVGLVG